MVEGFRIDQLGAWLCLTNAAKLPCWEIWGDTFLGQESQCNFYDF